MNMIKDFAMSQGLQFVAVSDLTIAKTLKIKHLRSGKIAANHPIKEARGVAVLAFGYDELGNIVALCADKIVRQFVK